MIDLDKEAHYFTQEIDHYHAIALLMVAPQKLFFKMHRSLDRFLQMPLGAV